MAEPFAGVAVLACMNSPDLFFKPFASLGLLTCMMPEPFSEIHAQHPSARISVTALPVLRMLLSYENVTCLQPSALSCQVLCHQTAHLHGSIRLTVDPSVVRKKIPASRHN